MHTSKVLRATDFQYVRRAMDGGADADMDLLYPDYQISDRIGVVSPQVADGLFYTSYALLGLTTMFYDRLRASTSDFFDYPQHFAFLGRTPESMNADGSGVVEGISLDATWGNLDVWPDSQWQFAPATATAMIKKVFDFQINRLFWPASLTPQPGEGQLPRYVRRILGTRLKNVYYYKASDPDLEIQVNQAVEDLVQTSLGHLPLTTDAQAQREAMHSSDHGRNFRECHRRVSVQEFLQTLSPCFEQG